MLLESLAAGTGGCRPRQGLQSSGALQEHPFPGGESSWLEGTREAGLQSNTILAPFCGGGFPRLNVLSLVLGQAEWRQSAMKSPARAGTGVLLKYLSVVSAVGIED